MACLGDIPRVLRSVGPWGLTKRVGQQVSEDSLLVWAAALAYSWLFAIFPFLIFLMSLLPYLPADTKAAAMSEMQKSIYGFLPTSSAADTLWNNVSSILSQPHKGLLSVGLILALWGASGGMNMTITALDKCYELDQGGRPFYWQRPLAIGLTAVIAVLVILLLVLLPIGTIATAWIEKHGSVYVSWPVLWAWKILRYPAALLVMFLILSILYHFGPNIRQRFRFVTPGAIFSVIVWILLAVVFRLYVNKFADYNKTYGTVGGVAILLLAFYIDAVVLLIGAEINSELDFEVLGVQRGSSDFTKAATEREGSSAAPPSSSGEPSATDNERRALNP